MLLIGSRALSSWGEKFLSPARRSWDYDYICKYSEFNSFIKNLNVHKKIPLNHGKTIAVFTKEKQIYEFEIAWPNSSAEMLLNMLPIHSNLTKQQNNIWIASPNLVFTLKKSHRYLKDSPHFLKTMVDFNHLHQIGCVVPKELEDWYKIRVKETYCYDHPNLNQNKIDFFADDNIPYKYDHDTIHLAIKHFDKPAYEYFKEEGQEVKCSKQLFFKQPKKVQLFAVLEEAYVLALERSQIPLPTPCSPKLSFDMALMKVCTSITSGWFRAFAYENYFDVQALYDNNYVDRFWDGVKNGVVKEL